MALPTPPALASPPLMSPPPSPLPPAEMFAPLLFESSNGFAVLDASGRYVYVSASMCSLLSLDKEALLGCVTALRRTARFSAMRFRCVVCASPAAPRRVDGARALLARRRTAAELVARDDRAALNALLDEARRCAALGQPAETFARVSHACGEGAPMLPVEVKACTDGGELIFCVFLDARMPARLESVLPEVRRRGCCCCCACQHSALTRARVAAPISQFLLSTSAPCGRCNHSSTPAC
jgi:hypothetical protein